MELADRRTAITKIAEMPAEQVLKVLIFMAGMEAGAAAKDKSQFIVVCFSEYSE